MTDPIADMLTRIRNAQLAKKREVLIPFSRIKFALASLLASEGYISSVERVTDGFPQLLLTIKYQGRTPVIRSIKRVSRPSRRVYVSAQEIPHVTGGLGIAILSTSQGLMTNRQARKLKVGGEVLCELF